jgi:hypothetical protein
MNKKIVGIFVFILMLFTAVIPVIGVIKNSDKNLSEMTNVPKKVNNEYSSIDSKYCDCNSETFDGCLRVTLKRDLNLISVKFMVENLCNETQYGIHWSISIDATNGYWNSSDSGDINILQDYTTIATRSILRVGFFHMIVKVGNNITQNYSGFTFPPIIFVYPTPTTHPEGCYLVYPPHLINFFITPFTIHNICNQTQNNVNWTIIMSGLHSVNGQWHVYTGGNIPSVVDNAKISISTFGNGEWGLFNTTVTVGGNIFTFYGFIFFFIIIYFIPF